MVLISKSNRLKISGKDKKCYKIVKLVQNRYVTPEYEAQIIICSKKNGIPYGTEFIAFDDAKADIYGTEDDFCFGSGLIHTYKWPDQAKSMVRNYYMNDPIIELYECIIPKGTEYIEGRTTYNKRSFASKKIIFIKRIT